MQEPRLATLSPIAVRAAPSPFMLDACGEVTEASRGWAQAYMVAWSRQGGLLGEC